VDKSLIDMLWVIVASGLVFLMQPGFAALESGLTRSKNSINVAVKNYTDMVVAVVLFWLFGFGLMFGSSFRGLIGNDTFLPVLDLNPEQASFFLFQGMFVATTATIVSGAVAERVRFSAYLYITIVISGLIYPVFGHWAWKTGEGGNGWLSAMGFVDFAGSTVVHSVGGWVALAAVLLIGPRTNRFGKDGTSNKIQGHDLPVAILGAMLLFFGWFGFNGGSTLEMNRSVAVIIVNTVLAGCTGALVGLLLGWGISRVADVSNLINGSLAGLVSITANCHAVSSADSLIIGGIGGIIAVLLERLLDKLKIDDVVGAFPVHAGGGIWGTLAVAIFGDPEILGTGLSFGQQLGIQITGIAVAGLWAFGLGYLLLFIINKITPIRVDPEDEHIGLNVAEHGATTEIVELFQAMDRQEQTGDLSMQLPVEPFTEIGQIASKFNKVMEALYVSNRERAAIMENISQGLFLLDRRGEILPGYSRAFEEITGVANLAGKRFVSKMTGILPDDSLSSFQDYFDLMLDPSHDESDLSGLNPLRKVQASFSNDHKFFEIRFMRIGNRESVSQLLGSITDITENVKLENQLKQTQESTRKEMEKVFQIIHVNADELANFVASAREEIGRINTILSYNKENNDLPKEKLRHKITRIYSSMHAIKGDASMLSLNFISDMVHSFEEKLDGILRQDEITTDDFLPILFMVTSIDHDLNEIFGFIERLQDFQKVFSEQSGDMQFALMKKMSQLTDSLADDIGKRVMFRYEFENGVMVPGRHMKMMKDVLIQLIRNSISHGIEFPDQRIAAGKHEDGMIDLHLNTIGNSVEIVYRDDGRGLDLDKIRQSAISKGSYPKAEIMTWNSARLAKLIFDPSFSTADEVTTHAGRGIGMDVIRSRIKDAGGQLKVSFSPGKFFEIAILLPV